MKAGLTIFVLLFCRIGFSQATFTVTPQEVDLGTVYFDTDDNHSGYTKVQKVYVRNYSQEPLIIQRVMWPSDFCPTASPTEPIMPGDSNFIIVSCEAFGYERNYTKALTICTNQGTVWVRIKGSFKKMPHLLEISDNIRSPLMHSRVETLDLSVKNVSDSELILSDFETLDLSECYIGKAGYRPGNNPSPLLSGKPALTIENNPVVLKPGESTVLHPILEDTVPERSVASKLFFYSSSNHYKELISINIYSSVW